MGLLTPQQLEAFLTRYGWDYEALGDGEWSTGFAGEQRTFPLAIRLTETCVSFEVRPFVELDGEGRGVAALARELLELNERLQIVKVGLSDTGDVTLSCQALTAGFDFDSLASILGIIGYYADELASDLAAKAEGGSPAPLLS